MTFDGDDWRGVKRDANRVGRFGLGWILIIVLIVVVLGAGFWGLRTLLAPVTGAGEAYQEQQSSENWTAAQARFEDLYAEVIASDRNINVAFTALQVDPEDKTLQTNYTGVQQYCISVVADYNAEARKYLSEDFRAADLPDQISNSDPATDCKENT